MRHLLMVAAGGACGAVLRYAVQSATASLALPWGTFAVNAAGCLAIGALIGGVAGEPWFEGAGRAFLVVGVLGAFTTFSAFSADALALFRDGRVGWAAAYALGTVAVCLAAAYFGYRLGSALR